MSLLLGGAAIIVAYIVIIVRYPGAMRRWVSTLTIILNHAQTVAIISELDLTWPTSVRRIIAALGLDLLHVPESACILKLDFQPFWAYVITFCVVVILALSTIALLQAAAERRGRAALADQLEFVLSIVYSVQLTSSVRSDCARMIALA